MHEVRVGSAVTAALDKGQMVDILDGLCEFANGFWQQVRVISHFDLAGNLMFRQLRSVQNMWLALDQRPFKTLICTIDVEALAVLASRIEQEPPNMSRDVAVFDLDVA